MNVEGAAGLTVQSDVDGADEVRAGLVRDGVPGLLAAQDPTLWGEAAEAEAKNRLGWVDTFRRSRALVPRLAELHAELADLDRVVLAGMGGSSLAPEVIARTLGKPLTVLDTTDPHQVRAALSGRLDRTVLVVSSKSGSTVETDSHRRAFRQALLDSGVPDAEAARHLVVVTDPGSPLEGTGAYTVLADPHVGGRYSALTAFGLVPSALSGVDVGELLDQAEEFAASLAGTTDNPALALGAALGAAGGQLALVEDGTGIVGIGDWAEQLIAESTGKEGKGILPVVLETPGAPTGTGVAVATVGGSLPPGSVPGGGIRPDIAVNGPLGAQFLAWEYAVAVAGRVLGIDPFDQPNVAESKENTARLLASGVADAEPSFVEGDVAVYDSPERTLVGALRRLLGDVAPGGYVAVMAYLDRVGDVAAGALREALAVATDRPVTFGWGPRFLHSTGQYHKGGPQNGSFLQVTGEVTDDLDVPGRPYTFGRLQAAQAAGDRQALAGRGRPVLRLHLTDRANGLAELLGAARSL